MSVYILIWNSPPSTVTLSYDKGNQITGVREGRDLYQLQVRPSLRPSCHEVSSCSKTTLNLWHQRMAHVNYEYLLLMKRHNTLKGLNIQGGNNTKQFCEGCTEGKQSRSSFKSLNRTRKSSSGKLIHCDLCGPMRVTSAGGLR
jgi:hypothetical protein